MAITSIFNKLQNLIPHNTYPKPASYLANDEFNYRSKEELKIWGYKDTLGISQIKYTDIMNELDGSAKVTNTPESKGFFSTFSSSLKTVYDFGVKSFNIIKNTSSILSSKLAETFNLVSNKVFSYSDSNAEKAFNSLEQLKTLYDNELVEEILNASENKLDKIFEKVTYKELVRIISNISNDKLAAIINNVSDENLEKIVDSISDQNLPMILHLLPAEKIKQIMILIHGEEAVKQLENQQLLEEILNTPENELDKIKTTKLAELISDISDEDLERIVDSISDQNLPKILQLLSAEKVKQIMILIHGEEAVKQLEHQQLLEEIINTPDSELDKIKITYEKLAELINNTSDEDLERIVDSHSLSGSLVQQIITLIYNKKCAKQESDEVSDSDSGFSDYEDEIEVSGNQVRFSNSDFTTKLSGNDFGFFD